MGSFLANCLSEQLACDVHLSLERHVCCKSNLIGMYGVVFKAIVCLKFHTDKMCQLPTSRHACEAWYTAHSMAAMSINKHGTKYCMFFGLNIDYYSINEAWAFLLTAIWAEATTRDAFLFLTTLWPQSSLIFAVFNNRLLGSVAKQALHVLRLACWRTWQLGQGLNFGFVILKCTHIQKI